MKKQLMKDIKDIKEGEDEARKTLLLWALHPKHASPKVISVAQEWVKKAKK